MTTGQTMKLARIHDALERHAQWLKWNFESEEQIAFLTAITDELASLVTGSMGMTVRELAKTSFDLETGMDLPDFEEFDAMMVLRSELGIPYP